MKQGVRLLVKPGTFFNQLQFSTHHWIILVAFMILASIETHLGKQHYFYQVFADAAVAKYGLSWNQAIWFVTSLKLAFMLVATFGLATFIWLVGNIFGRRTSKRVLFRRLAVVFTVMLAGYTTQHLAGNSETYGLLSLGFYAWGLILGFFAIREQFALNYVEALVLGTFALLVVVSTWHFSNHVMETAARAQIMELAKKPANH